MPLPAAESSPAGAFLPRILAQERQRVAAAERQVPLAALRRRAERREMRDFAAALSFAQSGASAQPAARPRIVAELKQASPSRGLLRENFDVAAIAAGYAAAGAAALSVLTEGPHFRGRLEYLATARQSCALPLLRKDFIFSEYQIWEAAAAGADAVLLIVAAFGGLKVPRSVRASPAGGRSAAAATRGPHGLRSPWGGTDGSVPKRSGPAADDELARLLAAAEGAGLAALVEVHDGLELARARRAGARILGVNQRDLRTFAVDRGLAARLRQEAGEAAEDLIWVAESGLRTAEDLRQAAAAGYDAVLIGEHFMQAPDPAAALRQVIDGLNGHD